MNVADLASAKNELIEAIFTLAENNADFTALPSTDCDLQVKQKIVDATYYGVASQENVRKTYRAKMWLNDDAKVVKYQEILADTSRSIGVLPTPKLEFGKSMFKGKVLFKKERGAAFGFKKPLDPTSFGKAYNYSFDVEKIRGPIKEAVEAAGWKFEHVILGQ
jgi:hypothetical protein